MYQLAKLRMLESYYDFLDRFVDQRHFDSIYMAISGDSLEDVFKPVMRA